MNQPIRLYYIATILFLALDYLVGINVRVAFFENWPVGKAAYYLFCFACLLLVVWRPNWAVFVGAFESLVSIVALIFAMALRVLIVTDEMIESQSGWITTEEVVNYVIAGGIAYLSWIRGLRAPKASNVA